MTKIFPNVPTSDWKVEHDNWCNVLEHIRISTGIQPFTYPNSPKFIPSKIQICYTHGTNKQRGIIYAQDEVGDFVEFAIFYNDSPNVNITKFLLNNEKWAIDIKFPQQSEHFNDINMMLDWIETELKIKKN